MKKRLFCVLLGLLVGFSLPLSTMAIGGPISTEPIDLSPADNLIQTTIPQGAVAVGYNYQSEETIYYRVNAETLDLPNGYPYHNELLNENIASPNGIIDDGEDWEAVESTQAMPYSAIACIRMEFAVADDGFATAFLISPNVAMTAAHNLFEQSCEHKSGEWARRVEVYPGVANGVVQHGAAHALEVIIGAPYFTEKKAFQDELTEGGVFACKCHGTTTLSDYYDWAFILLDEPLGYQYGYFKYEFNSQTIGRDIHFSAYRYVSGDDALLANYAQFEQEGESIRTLYKKAQDLDQTYVMHYNLDAEDGQSGGPIFYYNATSNEYRVLAVHNVDYTYEDEEDGQEIEIGIVNQGCRITSQLFSFIHSYTAYVYRAEE